MVLIIAWISCNVWCINIIRLLYKTWMISFESCSIALFLCHFLWPYTNHTYRVTKSVFLRYIRLCGICPDAVTDVLQQQVFILIREANVLSQYGCTDIPYVFLFGFFYVINDKRRVIGVSPLQEKKFGINIRCSVYWYIQTRFRRSPFLNICLKVASTYKVFLHLMTHSKVLTERNKLFICCSTPKESKTFDDYHSITVYYITRNSYIYIYSCPEIVCLNYHEIKRILNATLRIMYISLRSTRPSLSFSWYIEDIFLVIDTPFRHGICIIIIYML